MTDFSVELVAADGSRIPLAEEQRVGRSGDCEITIEDARVSRKHALLRVVEHRVTVEDLGSSNGTCVNSLPAKGVVELADGDTVSFDKHRYVVAITGANEDEDATLVNADRTVVSAMGAETERRPLLEAESGAPPGEEAAAEGTEKLPGSWVDKGAADSTVILSMEELSAGEKRAAQTQRGSDLPHLIVLAADGGPAGMLELQTTAGQDVWEIGREPPCEIVLNEASVSERHAQLIHQGGRWKIVNLVSTNGIFVNGEKRLTAYLSDGDEIRLGLLSVVFRAAADGVSAPPASASATAAGMDTESNRGRRWLGWIAVALSLVVLLVAWLIL